MRRVVTGALELERAAKRIGSSLEAHPVIYIADADLFAAVVDVDLAEVCITSGVALVEGEGPADAFRLPDVAGVAVVPRAGAGHEMRALMEDIARCRRGPAISRCHAARRASPA